MTMEYDRNLFGEIERFVKIEIRGKSYEVPDRLELLRVFQFLDFEIDYARLCWNGSCYRCTVHITSPQEKRDALSCRVRSCENMVVAKLPMTIKEK